MPVTQVSGTTGERALRERDALPAWRPMLRDHSLPLENGNAGSPKTAILKAIRITAVSVRCHGLAQPLLGVRLPVSAFEADKD